MKLTNLKTLHKNLLKEYNKSDYLYTALFCEENIWQLLRTLSDNCNNELSTSKCITTNNLWVLFLSNSEQKIALLNQQAAEPGQPVIWDYHVILLAEIAQDFYIFDFDTRLDFVMPLHDYLQLTLITPEKLPADFVPSVRKIPAQSYLDYFYSDRGHMLGQIDVSDFPPWGLINADCEQRIALAEYLDFESKVHDAGSVFKVHSLSELQGWLESR